MTRSNRATMTILGAGAFGTALAIHLGRYHPKVFLWGRNTDRMSILEKTRVNTFYLPQQPLPNTVECTADLATALSQTLDVLIAVPSHQFSKILTLIKPYQHHWRHLLWVTKGLEPEKIQLLPKVVESELETTNYAILSGPTFANELAQGLPTNITISAPQLHLARTLQKIFDYGAFKTHISSDVIGVSIGGAMKNIMAIAIGICDGLNLGANACAALFTKSLAEMQYLGSALGAEPKTFLGLAGLGDLNLTCMNQQSRNRRLGFMIGQGETMQSIQKQFGCLSEGILNVRPVCALGKRQGITLPICEAVHSVLFDFQNPKQAIYNLLI